MIIEIDKVKKVFGQKLVLENIDLTITDGEIFGLLGPSGSGKTTLIKILTGQIKPTSGTANVLNCNVNNLNKSVYTNIGIVYENSGLYERLSCFDNLLIFAKIYGIKKNKILEVLEKVGLLESKNIPVNKLSTGMKQRLILARAIMHSPKLLFLDEPTSGLDPVSANRIHEIIKDLNKNTTTIFMTTHNMSEATKLCKNIGLLHKGKIIEYGTPLNICYKYNKNKKVNMIYNNKTEYVSFDDLSNYFSELPDIAQLNAIHSMEPNLEDVFIELTEERLV